MNTCNLPASLKHKLIRLCLDDLIFIGLFVKKIHCVILYFVFFFYFGKLDDLMGLRLMVVIRNLPFLIHYLPI